MKQHITREQLTELSKEGKEKLSKWWKPTTGDWFITRFSSTYYIYGQEDENDDDYGEMQLLTDQETDSGYYGWAINDTFPTPESQKDPYEFKAGKAARGIEILNNTLPLLSIGQMIEFLGEHTDGIYSYPVSEDDGKKYLVNQYIYGNEIESLCDWLWEEVKEILEADESI